MDQTNADRFNLTPTQHSKRAKAMKIRLLLAAIILLLGFPALSGLQAAYDPNRGQWISRDPIGESGGTNLYEYVSNEPVLRIDPLGLFDESFPPEAVIDQSDDVERQKNESPEEQILNAKLNKCAYECSGLKDLIGPTLVILGQPIIPKGGPVLPGASDMTSPASKAAGKLFPQKLPRSVFPKGIWAPTTANPTASVVFHK